MIDLATLEQQALSLDLKERGHLASVLLRSLDDDQDGDNLSEEETEKLWLDEAIRRNKEMDEDPSIGRPAEDVMRDLRARFG